MKKLLVLLCASAVVISACSSSQEPVAAQDAPAPVKHKHHKHASGINCDK
jgi:hypothetical protein